MARFFSGCRPVTTSKLGENTVNYCLGHHHGSRLGLTLARLGLVVTQILHRILFIQNSIDTSKTI